MNSRIVQNMIGNFGVLSVFHACQSLMIKGSNPSSLQFIDGNTMFSMGSSLLFFNSRISQMNTIQAVYCWKAN